MAVVIHTGKLKYRCVGEGHGTAVFEKGLAIDHQPSMALQALIGLRCLGHGVLSHAHADLEINSVYPQHPKDHQRAHEAIHAIDSPVASKKKIRVCAYLVDQHITIRCVD